MNARPPHPEATSAASPVETEDRELASRVQLYLGTTRPVLSNVRVDAERGNVRLKGTVPTFHLRQLAVASARRVAGVRNVVDELTVKPEGKSI